ncbi:MAG: hypothetical protein Wins2KO_20610 [Winogradskyella sp.]
MTKPKKVNYIMRRTLLIIALIMFCSCKNQTDQNNNSTSTISDSINKSDSLEEKLIIREETNSEFKVLDNSVANGLFKNTALTSDSGKLHSGFKSKLIEQSSKLYGEIRLNTYLKKVEIYDGNLTEMFAVLLSKNQQVLYDHIWIGNNGNIAECGMEVSFNYTPYGLSSKYSITCYDSYDKDTKKEFFTTETILSNLTIDGEKLLVKRDTIKNKFEFK